MEAERTESIVLRRFLASDAEPGMRHSAQTIRPDRFIASETEAINPLLDAGQRCLHETSLGEITAQNLDGEVPLFGESHLVHGVRCILDGDGVSSSRSVPECLDPAFEHYLESLDLTLVHGIPPLLTAAGHPAANESCRRLSLLGTRKRQFGPNALTAEYGKDAMGFP
jgi:hypothetical protein